jgi:hypothetical protein
MLQAMQILAREQWLDSIPAGRARSLVTERRLQEIEVHDSRTFETRSRPALARRYPRDFTFYLGNPFLRLLVCQYIAEWSEWDERPTFAKATARQA